MSSQLEKVDLSTVDHAHIASLDEELSRRISIVHPNVIRIIPDAARATEFEHQMSFRAGLRLYPKAILWSVVVSSAIVMEGFDKILLNNLFAYEPFKRNFGVLLADGSYELSAAWQSGLSTGALVGEILGLMITGMIAERLGYRKTIVGALILVVAFIFIVFFSQSTIQLLIGEILLGLPFGVFQTMTTTYAAEVCPVPLRAYLTTYVNLCWVLGQLLASGVLRAMVNRSDDWGYRIPFALQWIWPLPIIIGVCLAPESPWWLIRQGRLDEAKQSLLQLTTIDEHTDFDASDTIAMMEHTNALEKAASAGTSYCDCFTGTDSRRTEIVCFTWAIQVLCGSTFMGYSTYFYEQAGLAMDNAFTMSMAQFALGVIGTLCSWMLIRWFGRRSLYLAGELIMSCLLLIIGFLGLISHDNDAAQWTIGTMLLLYTFTYDATVGPVCYSLVSELSSTRLRAKTVVLARNLFNVAGLVTNIITPRMLNPSAWNWGAKSGFFWAGSCFVCFVWTFFRLPEPKGRTFGELDILFERGVPARSFKSTIVDPFMTGPERRASVVARNSVPAEHAVVH